MNGIGFVVFDLVIAKTNYKMQLEAPTFERLLRVVLVNKLTLPIGALDSAMAKLFRHRGNFGMPHVLAIPLLAIVVGCGGSSGGGNSPGSVDFDTTSDEKRIIRIMAVGDSITHGVRDPGPSASWRLPFTQSMDQDDCAYEMVGSQATNESHSAFVSAHEAYSAHQAGHFITGFSNWAGENSGIYSAIQNHTPDVVLLHLGTNDAIKAQPNQETVQEIDQIVATILDSGASVLVANVIPTYAEDIFNGVDARIAELGTQLEAYVVQLGNPQVQLVDVRTGFSKQLMHSDGIHPNDQGSQAIADAFYAVYKSNDYCE